MMTTTTRANTARVTVMMAMVMVRKMTMTTIILARTMMK